MTTPYGYVPPIERGEMSQRHVDVLRTGATLAGDVMVSRQQTHHARSDDNAMTHSLASLTYSAAYGVVFLVVTGFLGWLAWMRLDADPVLIIALLGVVWGCATYYALAYNRERGLHYSAAGIAHHELDDRKEVAMRAIDAHIELVRLQMGMDDELTPRITVRKRIHQDA